MQINQKIEEVNTDIVDNGNSGLANEIARDGLAAIFAGMKTGTGEATPEWKKLMEHFANDEKELNRLCGKDKEFNKSKWGLHCLAYIAGDSICTSNTTLKGGTKRSILMRDEIAGNTELQDNLDAESSTDSDTTKDLRGFKVDKPIFDTIFK